MKQLLLKRAHENGVTVKYNSFFGITVRLTPFKKPISGYSMTVKTGRQCPKRAYFVKDLPLLFKITVRPRDATHGLIVYYFCFVLLVASSKGSDDVQGDRGLIMMLWVSFVAGLDVAAGITFVGSYDTGIQQEECYNSCMNSHWYVNAATLFSTAGYGLILPWKD
ncbi:hypothetical protein Tco_1439217 [Tanacetum coccineum]